MNTQSSETACAPRNMFQSTPGPPSSARRSKKSPRRSTGEGKAHQHQHQHHPQNMLAYLNDIANRKGSVSLMKMKKHPITMTTSPENTFDYRNIDSDDDHGDGIEYGDVYDRHERERNNTTARVLFEKNATQKATNEMSSNRFCEFNGSPPAFRGPNNIVLEHTLTKRGRSAHFIIREHGDDYDTMFSVHVYGKKQRYSFQVPSSQVCCALMHVLSCDVM